MPLPTASSLRKLGTRINSVKTQQRAGSRVHQEQNKWLLADLNSLSASHPCALDSLSQESLLSIDFAFNVENAITKELKVEK